MSSSNSNNNKPYTIVLTGASGFLGQHCLETLLKEPNLHIHALHNSKPELESAIIEYVKKNPSSCISTYTVTALDITSEQDITEWVKTISNNNIDCCIHTAALSNPGKCQEDPGFARKINVPKNFFNALYQSNPEIKIIALSTDQVYDGQNAPYTEDSVAEPVNVYGNTKIELEKYLLEQKEKNYPKSTVILLRSSIILGCKTPYIESHGTFLHFCLSRMGIETTYWSDEIRSVISVSDVVNVIIKFIQSHNNNDDNISGIYNMGGPENVSRYDMAIAVLKHMCVDVSVAQSALKAAQPPSKTTEGAVVVPSPLNIAMDSNKLLKTTGISKFLTLDEIVQKTFVI